MDFEGSRVEKIENGYANFMEEFVAILQRQSIPSA